VWVRAMAAVSVVRGTLNSRLVADIDSEGLAISHSQASDKRGSSIEPVYIVLLFNLLSTAMVVDCSNVGERCDAR
jgi:hypothetical protein